MGVALLVVALALTLTFVSSCKKKPKTVVLPVERVVYWPLTGREVELSETEGERIETEYLLTLPGIEEREQSEIDAFIAQYSEMLDEKEAAKEEKIERRPISIKIENSPEARPQSGLNSADIVFETMVEGGETRFNAIFHSKYPKKAGPVRSARLTDPWICNWLGTALFYSGSSSETDKRLGEKNIDKMSWSMAPSLYDKISSRYSPHNLYIYPTWKKLAAALKDDKHGTRFLSEVKLPFGPLPSDSAIEVKAAEDSEATEVTDNSALRAQIYFSGIADINWKWSEKDKRYYRYQDGSLQTDAEDGEKIFADTIVAMEAEYFEASTIDPAGNPTYDTDFAAGGKCVVFRDGKYFKGNWTASEKEFPKFISDDGEEITIKEGKTWFEVPDTYGYIKAKKK
jgi:hypothetical protein